MSLFHRRSDIGGHDRWEDPAGFRHEIQISAGMNEPIRINCSCGWSARPTTHADSIKMGSDHLFKYVSGEGLVRCVKCGDQVPVSTARWVRPRVGEDGAYMCGECTEGGRVVLEDTLRDDLIELERSLR